MRMMAIGRLAALLIAAWPALAFADPCDDIAKAEYAKKVAKKPPLSKAEYESVKAASSKKLLELEKLAQYWAAPTGGESDAEKTAGQARVRSAKKEPTEQLERADAGLKEYAEYDAFQQQITAGAAAEQKGKTEELPRVEAYLTKLRSQYTGKRNKPGLTAEEISKLDLSMIAKLDKVSALLVPYSCIPEVRAFLDREVQPERNWVSDGIARAKATSQQRPREQTFTITGNCKGTVLVRALDGGSLVYEVRVEHPGYEAVKSAYFLQCKPSVSNTKPECRNKRMNLLNAERGAGAIYNLQVDAPPAGYRTGVKLLDETNRPICQAKT